MGLVNLKYILAKVYSEFKVKYTQSILESKGKFKVYEFEMRLQQYFGVLSEDIKYTLYRVHVYTECSCRYACDPAHEFSTGGGIKTACILFSIPTACRFLLLNIHS